MRTRLVLISLLSVFAGCVGGPSKCYVTLSPHGQPTAEACEKGPVLTVRPITETNAAYYVPPYVLGALSYEGYVDAGALDANGDGEMPAGRHASGADGEATSSGEPPAGEMTDAGAVPASAALAAIGPHRGSRRTELPDLALSLAPNAQGDGTSDLQALWDAPLVAGPAISGPVVGDRQSRPGRAGPARAALEPH